MVYVEAHLLLGSIVEVTRTNGSWDEAVITDMSLEVAHPLTLDGVKEQDYFVVTFVDGSMKNILMQQDLSLFMRPLHDTGGHIVSQLKLLQHRKRVRDADNSDEKIDFSSTQDHPQPEASSSGLSRLMPPPPPPKKSRTVATPVAPAKRPCDDDISDDELLHAVLLYESQLRTPKDG